MNQLNELAELDVSDSMKKNIEALTKAIESVDTASQEDATQKLVQIHSKVEEIEEYFWRPVDSKDVYERLIAIADALKDEDKVRHYQYQIRLREANDLEFQGRVQDFYGNKVKAIEFYAKALELIPVHELALPAHNKALKSLQNARTEAPKIEKKMELFQDDPKLWLKYGVALLIQGEVKRAIECFDRTIELDPANPDAHARRGTAMESLGDYEGAKKFLEKALELKPSSMIAKRGLNYVNYFLEQ
ncbi:MAG: tetratricopeptide repeat protein [Methanomassiliicoccales archaeon]|nr:MAG: tetratricopeptide repeat protein [Methanomassiliicoccales archaeon]